MFKISEIFAFSKEKFRKIPILKQFEWFEWFEWFGPSPIEPESTLRRTLARRRVHASDHIAIAATDAAAARNKEGCRIVLAQSRARAAQQRPLDPKW